MLAVILGTRFGDANLDTNVNINDFSVLAANFNVSGGWAKGSFNGDGVVNIQDFAQLAANFNQSGPNPIMLARTVVPEPNLGLLAFVALVGRRRR
jgi:hypothetical protein